MGYVGRGFPYRAFVSARQVMQSKTITTGTTLLAVGVLFGLVHSAAAMPPVNDDFANAVNLTPVLDVVLVAPTVDNTAATNELNEPPFLDSGDLPLYSVWWRVSIPTGAQTLTVGCERVLAVSRCLRIESRRWEGGDAPQPQSTSPSCSAVCPLRGYRPRGARHCTRVLHATSRTHTQHPRGAHQPLWRQAAGAVGRGAGPIGSPHPGMILLTQLTYHLWPP